MSILPISHPWIAAPTVCCIKRLIHLKYFESIKDKNSLPLMRPCHILLLVFWMLFLGAYKGSGIFRARDLSMYIL